MIYSNGSNEVSLLDLSIIFDFYLYLDRFIVSLLCIVGVVNIGAIIFYAGYTAYSKYIERITNRVEITINSGYIINPVECITKEEREDFYEIYPCQKYKKILAQNAQRKKISMAIFIVTSVLLWSSLIYIVLFKEHSHKTYRDILNDLKIENIKFTLRKVQTTGCSEETKRI